MPLWFSVKVESSIISGPKHLYQAIVSTRYLSQDLKAVIDPMIEQNAYFAHPENLLLAMAMDERRHVRELAFRRILKARHLRSTGKTPVRFFKVPEVNFSATDYIDIIPWQLTRLYPPPLLRHICDEHIQALIESGSMPERDVRGFPCHTQSVERV